MNERRSMNRNYEWTDERSNDQTNERWTMNRNYERTKNDKYELWMNEERWIGTMNERTNDRNFGSITAEQRLFGRMNGWTIEWSVERTMNDERWIGTMNEWGTMNMNYERTDEWSNDRTNERPEFRQHNGWTKIIWTYERSNDQTNKWWTMNRNYERTKNDE
jgi:hypothetical protein